MEATLALSLDNVSRLTGLSESRLRRWDRTGFFAPSFALPNRRIPHSRIYSLEDLVALLAINKLVEYGVSHRRLRDVVPLIKDVPAGEWGDKRIFVVEGDVLFDEKAAMDARKAHGNRAVSDVATIDMPALVEDARRRVRQLSVRTPDQIGRVVRDRWIMNGEPILAGTRIPTATVFDYASHGSSPEEIVSWYPRLTKEDVAAAVAFETQRRRGDGKLKAAG